MLAEKPWKPDAVLRLFLALVTCVWVGALVGSLLSHLTSTWPKPQSDFLQIAIAAFFLEIPAFVWIAMFLQQHKINWKDAFGWSLCDPATAAAYGVLAAMLFLPVAWGLQWFSDFAMRLVHINPEQQVAVQEMQADGITIPEKILMGVIAIVLAPLVEEMLFRGILYPAIKRAGRPRLALWVSSVLFAAVHANMVTFLPLMVFALVLVHLYETYQNLLASVVAHSFFNTVNFFILIFQDQLIRFFHLT